MSTEVVDQAPALLLVGGERRPVVHEIHAIEERPFAVRNPVRPAETHVRLHEFIALGILCLEHRQAS